MRLFQTLSLVVVAMLISACTTGGRSAAMETSTVVARLPPDLCVVPSPRPQRPAAAGLVRPVDAAERAATAEILTWLSALIDHDAELTRRGRLVAASRACQS